MINKLLLGSIPSLAGHTGPGPQELLAGTLQKGYFGQVAFSQMPTASELSVGLGMSEGILNSTPQQYWYKFAHNDKVLFFPQRALRYDVSRQEIGLAGLAYGKLFEYNGSVFNVRLMTGRNLPSSEWNSLIYNIAAPAIKGTGAWASYTNTQLAITGNGWVSTVQETNGSNCYYRPANNTDISTEGTGAIAHKNTNFGWRPILELVS